MKLMGDFHNPDRLQINLFSPEDGWVAVETFIIY
jgi:hypothetical protein